MSPGLLDTPTLLRRNLVFGDLDEDVLATVAEHMDLLTVRGGGLLFAAGEPSDALYVLRSGSIGIFRPPRAGGAPHLAGVLGSGETAGRRRAAAGPAARRGRARPARHRAAALVAARASSP